MHILALVYCTHRLLVCVFERTLHLSARSVWESSSQESSGNERRAHTHGCGENIYLYRTCTRYTAVLDRTRSTCLVYDTYSGSIGSEFRWTLKNTRPYRYTLDSARLALLDMPPYIFVHERPSGALCSVLHHHEEHEQRMAQTISSTYIPGRQCCSCCALSVRLLMVFT